MSTGTTSMSTTIEQNLPDADIRRTALATLALDVFTKIAAEGSDWREFFQIASDVQRLIRPDEPPTPVFAASSNRAMPVVDVENSVHDDYIICLEDGKKLKTLKRHLTRLGMTIDEYKTKYGLPSNYPTVAPIYSRQRSAMAKALDFGKRTANDTDAPPKVAKKLDAPAP